MDVNFTYDSYRYMLSLIKKQGYVFTDYLSYESCGEEPCCIIRHDIDNSIEKAYEMFLTELDFCEGGIHSTFYVLMTSNFYNPASVKNKKMLRKIYEGGSHIGLHFDEKAYLEYPESVRMEYVEKEKNLLEEILELPICSVSMHRPSKTTLDSNWQFKDMVNSYSDIFFHEFKYLSDSRRQWREPVLDIIQKKEYKKIHILTHPFWYNDVELNIHDTLAHFLNSASSDRYEFLEDNITDLSSIMKMDYNAKDF